MGALDRGLDLSRFKARFKFRVWPLFASITLGELFNNSNLRLLNYKLIKKYYLT